MYEMLSRFKLEENFTFGNDIHMDWIHVQYVTIIICVCKNFKLNILNFEIKFLKILKICYKMTGAKRCGFLEFWI